jgi:DUF4097 and DUF4098 domain-containing protein YvlB
MLHHMLIAVLCLTSCISSASAKSEIEETIEQTLDFKSGQQLKVSGVNGSITIKVGNENRIHMVAIKKAKAKTKKEAQDVLDATWIEILPITDGLKIATKHPNKKMLRGGKSVLVNYTLTVPQVLTLSASTINGEIEIANTEGEIRAKTTNGKITIDGSKGVLITRTTNGEIEIKNVAGSVDAKTTNGGIKLDQIRGGINAKTTNGSVDGNIIKLPNESVQIQTTNGRISLTLPTDVQAQLKAQTANGRISTDIPITLQGNFSRRFLQGALNGGGNIHISLQTTNGNINIDPQ